MSAAVAAHGLPSVLISSALGFRLNRVLAESAAVPRDRLLLPPLGWCAAGVGLTVAADVSLFFEGLVEGTMIVAGGGMLTVAATGTGATDENKLAVLLRPTAADAAAVVEVVVVVV
jgi:hypothetical protein